MIRAKAYKRGNRIGVLFPYDKEAIATIKEVPGYRFHPKKSGEPAHWSVPLDLTSARRLRDAFGPGLTLAPEIAAWGRDAVRRERELLRLMKDGDSRLERIPAEAQEWLRPYQRVDIHLMAMKNILNTNQPGTGKTVETIFAAVEHGSPKPNLVVAGTTSHEDPWADELAEHLPNATVFWGLDLAERDEAMQRAREAILDGQENVWLIITPESLRLEEIKSPSDLRPVVKRGRKGQMFTTKEKNAWMFEIEWGTVTVDEFHRFGVGDNPDTMFAKALQLIDSERIWLLSGTPTGGKPIRLWGALHVIEPESFASKWRWADHWLVIEDNGFGKTIGGFQKGRLDEFYKAHAEYIIRRDRADVLPGLPPKVYIDVPCPMTKKQRAAYTQFAKVGEIRIDGERLSAENILTEYARLKQFANALCKVENGIVRPSTTSGKLPRLLDKLDEFGVRAKQPEPGARALVVSESQRFIECVEGFLAKAGLNVRRLDGGVTGRDRSEVLKWYKRESDDARVIVATTATCGTSLNLGMTGSIHILDETWNPDDQEQVEDRGMRNRTEPLYILYYRTQKSIQQYVHEVTSDKALDNEALQEIRKMLRADFDA